MQINTTISNISLSFFQISQMPKSRIVVAVAVGSSLF